METFDTSARIAVLETELKNLVNELREHRKDSKDHHNTMMEKIEELDERIQIIERWRWMVVGGALALGYIVSHIVKF
jgi:uncharacterized protein (UPF0305 family)